MDKGITFGERLHQLAEAVGKLFGIGVNEISEAAENSETINMKLDDADRATEIDAQKTLDVISDALTEFGNIERQLEQKRETVDHWNSMGEKEAEEASKYSEDSAEFAKHEKLSKQAFAQAEMVAPELDMLQKAYDKAKPMADQAIKQAERVGFSSTDAKSQTAILRVQNATEEGRVMLARAARSGGLERTKEILESTRKSINTKSARASAEEQINSVLPQNPSTVEAEIAMNDRDSRVNDKFAATMARLKTPTTSETPTA